MKNPIANVSLLLVFLLLMGTACAPRTPRSVPMDDNTDSTTGLPEDVRAPISASYSDYAGRYRIDQADLGNATITVENERLYGTVGTRPRVELVPGTDRDLFNVQGMQGVQVRFTRNAQNRVTGIQLSSNDGSVRGEKVE